METAGISGRLKLADGDVFVQAGSRAELEERAPAALAALKPGGRLWVAYLADGSADLNRNHGWGALHRAGLTATGEETVDDRWAAMRFAPLAAVPGAAIPAADMLPVGRHASVLFRVVRMAAIPVFHLLFRFDVKGPEHVPDSAYVLIANHLGWMDAISLLLLLPAEPRIHFLADPTSMLRNRPLWLLVRGAGGVVPVDRAQRDHTLLFAQVGRCLERGGVVALFPEGDFGPGEGQVLPFKKGFAHFAIDARVPVLPVGLAGMKELWAGKRLSMRIGEPIATDGRTVDELVKLGQDAVASLLPDYRDPGGRKPLRRWLTSLF
ncbi:MAG TPA: 1-acyl-sn-glycerol-3-phosphate acyltransferase [Candidatus Dormibacteraeota bacterium]|nr:1-acyl-sn-glycerol-3-phosphate acyltransferase [Candidatus Dormibacteraeota bacterium]